MWILVHYSSDFGSAHNHNDKGRHVQESSPTGVIGYEYNALGRKTRTWAGGVGATANTALSDFTYDYYELGRLKYVNTVKRDGATVDGNGTANGTPPETTTYHYDLLGRPDYTEMPNEVVEDFTFDNMDRLDVMRHFASDSNNANLTDNALKDIFDYLYRADGKRTGVDAKFGGSGIGYQSIGTVTGAAVTNNYTWNYDNAGRLISEQLDNGTATNPNDTTLDQGESYIMDLVGNRIRRTIDKVGTANDVTDIYTYDGSDRLQTENRYAGLFATGTPTGASLQSTAYSWTGTQQTSKAVNVPSISTVTQAMSYGLNGQLEKVITTTLDGSSTVTGRVQVEYRYDVSGIRFIAVDTTDTNLSTTAVDGSPTGRTEYLIDHNNATGYAQTIIETTKNASGQVTKRVSYTFGTDEITQTTSDINPATGAVSASTTLTFGHDGHGSTAVLFGTAAAIAQIFTYTAYGELLSIHNSAGTPQALNLALTSMLYNGEGIDTRTGLYNFRARWYSPTAGRFADRLDPFGGNPNDPFSFNKYGFVHANPILGIDPTGNEFSLGGMLSSIGITGFNFGSQGVAHYAARVGVVTALQTGFEAFLTQQIYSWFLPGQKDDTDWGYAFATNYISNFATAGLKAGFVVKFLIDTLINTISDIAIGKFSWISLGIRALVFAGGAGLKAAGAKLIQKASQKGGSQLGSFGDEMVEFTDDFREMVIKQSLPNSCGQTCSMRVWFEQGIERLSFFFRHSEATTPAELAEFLTKNGARASEDLSTPLGKISTNLTEEHPTSQNDQLVGAIPNAP